MTTLSDNLKNALGNVRPAHIMSDISSAHEGNRAALYRAARTKLTIFYVTVLLVLSLLLTLSFRMLAEREFNRAGSLQRGAVQHLLFGYYSVPVRPNTEFNSLQLLQDREVRRHLNEDVLLINLFVFVASGILSYWYAGRTLKPIEDAHEAQARFAADASHELRTPLANLQLENEVFLRQKNFTPAEAEALIKSNLEEVQRLENLADNLLALTNFETATLELVPTDIKSVIQTALTNFEKALQASRITATKHVAAAQVYGQFDSLVQLLGIVLDNAIKYGPEGSRIVIDGRLSDHHYQLSIRDEGPGIATEDLPHVFDRLYRGDKSRTGRTHGYGLGLSLAKEIARANRATITLRNYPKGGTQCVITFTLADKMPSQLL